jgi:hypothetical protein
MGSKHEQLLEAAKKAADLIFSDTSVKPIDTRASLVDLRDHTDMLVDAVETSMADDNGEE